MAFTRIAMILQRMESETKVIPPPTNDFDLNTKPKPPEGDPVFLSDKNFMLTCEIMNVITNHTFIVWEFVTGKEKYKEEEKGSSNTQKSKFIFTIEQFINSKEGFDFSISTNEIKQIGKDLNISARSVTRYLKELVNDGLLEKIGHGEYDLKRKDND